ncbi:MAG: hypothetical protein ACTHN8_14640 [Angustibacter sp.]
MTDVRRPDQARGGTAVTPSPRRRRVAGERSRPVLRPEPAVEETPEPTPEATRDANPTLEGAREGGERVTSRQSEGEQEAGRRVPGWVLVALTALLVVILVAVGLLVRADRQARAVDEARGEAVSAARTAATAILSYDYRHLDADFAKGRALTAPPFSQQYAKTTADAVKQVATQTKATVVAQVAAVGVEQASAHRVVVVLFVNQTTTSSRLERPQVDQNRVEMTLVERDGRWLVSQVSGL